MVARAIKLRETGDKLREAGDKPREAAEPASETHERLSQRKRPESGRYLLQVDRQTKASYATIETAQAAGLAIKTGHPVVQVSVYDSVECQNSLWSCPPRLGRHAASNSGCSFGRGRSRRQMHRSCDKGTMPMKKSIPDTMFSDREQIRLSALNNWVLDHGVTEIVMTERQFWKFVTVQPLAEKPWTTFMGRTIRVPDMPEASQKHLGLFDKQGPGQI